METASELLTVVQAAHFLGLHAVTVRAMARWHRLPVVKLGRGWRLVRDDLLAFMRAQYERRALQGDRQELGPCHSTNARTHRIGGSSCPTTVARCRRALGLPIDGKLSSSMTSGKPNCGSRTG